MQTNFNYPGKSLSAVQDLTVYKNINLQDTTNADKVGIIYKGTVPFIHNFNYGDNGTVATAGYNTFVGKNAGNLNMGSTATNTYEASYNTLIGTNSGNSITTAYGNSAIGMNSLYKISTGYNNVACGMSAAYNITGGYLNTVIGYESLRLLTLGYKQVALGYNAGTYIAGGSTANQTSNTSVYLGAETKANVSGDTNEIVIGYDATGGGSNTATIGNDNITAWYLGQYTSIAHDGTDGEIDVSRGGASDLHIKTGTAKTLVLDTVVWSDLQVQMGNVATSGWFGGAEYADIVEYNDGIAIEFQNDSSNNYLVRFNCQIPHEYKEGEDVEFHIHVADNSGTTGNAVFKLTYEWANMGDTFPTSASVSKTFAIDGTDKKHQFEDIATTISGTGKKISSILLCTLERVAGDAADTFSESVYVTGIDFHFPMDGIGSRTQGAK